MKYLLDTNILILFNNEDFDTVNKIKTIQSFYVSSISVGELYYGAYKSLYINYNLLKVKNLVQCNYLCMINDLTANCYGIIRAEQKKKGKPLSHNDLWIASTAMEHDLVLVTRDSALLDLDCVKTEKW